MAVFTCVQCGHSQTVEDKHAGRNATCPKCKTQSVVQQSGSTNCSQETVPESERFRIRRRPTLGMGIHYARNPRLSILNDASSLAREWIVIDDLMLPVRFENVCGVTPVVDEDSMKTGVVQYAYAVELTIRTICTPVTAVEVRFLTFDIWGSHIRTLSTEHVADIAADEEYACKGKWSLFSLNEGWNFLACIGYIARVRDGEGRVLTADSSTILREAQRFSERFTEEDLEPKAPKKDS